jgi:hypothetical protein
MDDFENAHNSCGEALKYAKTKFARKSVEALLAKGELIYYTKSLKGEFAQAEKGFSENLNAEEDTGDAVRITLVRTYLMLNNRRKTIAYQKTVPTFFKAPEAAEQ